MKPGCGSTREDCLPRQTPDGGRKQNVGVMGYGTERVIAATESAPTGTEQLIFRQPMPPGLLEIERTRRQSIWNVWSSRHDPESWAMHARNCILPIKGEGVLRKEGIESLESRLAAHSTSGAIIGNRN